LLPTVTRFGFVFWFCFLVLFFGFVFWFCFLVLFFPLVFSVYFVVKKGFSFSFSDFRMVRSVILRFYKGRGELVFGFVFPFSVFRVFRG